MLVVAALVLMLGGYSLCWYADRRPIDSTEPLSADAAALNRAGAALAMTGVALVAVVLWRN